MKLVVTVVLTCLAVCLLTITSQQSFSNEPIEVMIIGGQNNHDWAKSTPFMKKILDSAGHFDTTVYNAPSKDAPAEAWADWQPQFEQFDCIILDYNGQMWPEQIKKDFENYITNGGGAVAIHATNNSFNGWKEFEQMIGLLWRGTKYGYSLYIEKNGKIVREEPGEGRGMGHGGQYDWIMTTRDTKHPITAGLPTTWMHVRDELYHGQRGPAKGVNILLSAYSDPAPGRGGTGKHEPIVWWISYGRGKVVTNLMGHVGNLTPMQCVGFQTVLCRSCEWVANGKCTTPVPDNFPTADKTSLND